MLWLIVSIAVLLSLLSLRGESVRMHYYRTPPRWKGRPTPVTVIVPVKGMDEGLRENLASLARLDYPDYELIVTAKSAADLPAEAVPAKARVVLAGAGPADTGEKIHNLLAAVRSARTESEIFVFADSDGRVPPGWLQALVGALDQDGVGAATGYRWHLPEPVDAWSMLRSVWNAVIAGGMGPGKNNFCWGGAMAIRRETFERLNVPAWWKGAISDDYRLSEAVKAAGLRIAFAPGALVAATDHTTGAEFLGWIRRQMTITRFYAPGLWKLALFAHVVYCGAMLAALYLMAQGSVAAGLALALQLGSGWYKGWNRIAAARMAMPEYAGWFARYGWLHTLLVPVGTWLWLYSCCAAAFSDRIQWRGYMHRLRRVPPVAVLALVAWLAQAETPAFPAAEGAGAMAAGGRKGMVVRVTNLNAAGPGSFAEAVSQPNRIVVFTVSGVIDLKDGKAGKHGTIHIRHPHITIAGQSAPGEGITIQNGALSVEAGDVIVRHLRVRRGFVRKGDMGDGITVKGGFSDVIVDHVSAAWATDENLTMTNANRVTGQWFLNAEALDYFNTEQSPNRHAYGSLFGSSTPDGRMTIHHSIYAHNRLRNARTTGGDHELAPPVLEFVNNVIYDSKEMASHTGSQPIYGNWIGNFLKDGPSTGIDGHDAKGVLFTILHHAGTRLFLSGNWIEGYPDRTADNWKAVRYGRGLTEDPQFRAAARFPAPRVTVQPAQAAYEAVLEDAGATLPSRDAIDARIVTDIRKGTGAVINFETDVPERARRPAVHSLPAPLDTDGDGMPDEWERQHGLDPRNAKDAMADDDGDGYVNVEEYLNNTSPRNETKPVVFVSAFDSRGYRDGNKPGVFKIWRTGPLDKELVVPYAGNGKAATIRIPAGEPFVKLAVAPDRYRSVKSLVLSLKAGNGYTTGCPAQAMVVFEDGALPNPVNIRSIDNRGGATEDEYRLGAEKLKRHNEARPEKIRKRQEAARKPVKD